LAKGVGSWGHLEQGSGKGKHRCTSNIPAVGRGECPVLMLPKKKDNSKKGTRFERLRGKGRIQRGGTIVLETRTQGKQGGSSANETFPGEKVKLKKRGRWEGEKIAFSSTSGRKRGKGANGTGSVGNQPSSKKPSRRRRTTVFRKGGGKRWVRTIGLEGFARWDTPKGTKGCCWGGN